LASLNRRRAAVTLEPFVRLSNQVRRQLQSEAEALVRVLQPAAEAYAVDFQSK
jgi:hypothetical protein